MYLGTDRGKSNLEDLDERIEISKWLHRLLRFFNGIATNIYIYIYIRCAWRLFRGTLNVPTRGTFGNHERTRCFLRG